MTTLKLCMIFKIHYSNQEFNKFIVTDFHGDFVGIDKKKKKISTIVVVIIKYF